MKRLAVLETKDHPRPFRLARIPPLVHRRPLHHDVSPPHHGDLATVEDALDRALHNDPVVKALRPVHYARVPRGEFHEPQHGAAS